MKSKSYKPTTVKIASDLLRKIDEVKPESLPLTTYIRNAIEADVRSKQIFKSAKAYRSFLDQHPKENGWLKEWEKSRLEISRK